MSERRIFPAEMTEHQYEVLAAALLEAQDDAWERLTAAEKALVLEHAMTVVAIARRLEKAVN